MKREELAEENYAKDGYFEDLMRMMDKEKGENRTAQARIQQLEKELEEIEI